MDLSWPHHQVVSVYEYTPNDTYLGELTKMNLPSVRDFVQLIQESGKGGFLYCCDVFQTYPQLPMDPCDLPLVGLKVQDMYFMDLSLPFGLRWAESCSQDVTSLVVKSLKNSGV